MIGHEQVSHDRRMTWRTDVDRGVVYVEMGAKGWPVDLRTIEEVLDQDRISWGRRISPDFWEWMPDQ